MKKIVLFAALLFSAANLYAQEPVSLSLEQCRSMALQTSEKVKRADIATQQAELDKQVAFTGYLPNFKGSASTYYTFPDKMTQGMGMELLIHGVYMAGLTIEQPLYTGGKIINGNKEAALGVTMMKENQRLERQKLLANLDNTYWSYVAVCDKVELTQAYAALLDSLYSDEQARVKQQMQTEADLLRIDSRRSQTDYQMKKAINGMEICRMALCHLIGLPLDTKVKATDAPLLEKEPEVVTSGDITNRPEYALLQQQVDMSKLDVKMARADFLPTLGMGLGYNFYGNLKVNMSGKDDQGNPYSTSNKYSGNGGMVTLSLSIPIFHFGEGPKKIHRAKLAVESKQLELEENTRLLNIEREQAFRNLSDSRSMISSAKRAQDQAEENLRITRLRFNESLCTLTDMLDAQTQWQNAHSSLIEAQTQYKINETTYRKAAGLLD